MMTAAGFPNVVNVEGGTKAWTAAGLPVERQASQSAECSDARSGGSMSLWRQAQVGHGLLVLLGCAVGWLVHPIGYAFAALVGAGIAASGITGHCGTRKFMARMPWNRS